MSIKTVSSRVVYQNRWISVREDAIERGDGAPGIYGVIDRADFVVIIALENGVLHLVEQFRYPVQGRYWEFPQGGWETRPDADPALVARGELEEETGLVAGHMRYLGHLFTAYGMSSQGMHVFHASELAAGQRQLDPEEQDLITRAFSVERFEQMIRDSEIKDSATLAAYNLFRLKG